MPRVKAKVKPEVKYYTKNRVIKKKKTVNLVDEVHTMMVKKGFSNQYWEAHSGLSSPTIINMIKGRTRQPYYSTLEAILRAIGQEFTIQSVGKAQIVPIAPVKQERNVKFHYLRPAKYKVKKKG